MGPGRGPPPLPTARGGYEGSKHTATSQMSSTEGADIDHATKLIGGDAAPQPHLPSPRCTLLRCLARRRPRVVSHSRRRR